MLYHSGNVHCFRAGMIRQCRALNHGFYIVSIASIMYPTSSSCISPRNTFISKVGNACSPCINNSGENGRAINSPSALTERTSEIVPGNVFYAWVVFGG